MFYTYKSIKLICKNKILKSEIPPKYAPGHMHEEEVINCQV